MTSALVSIERQYFDGSFENGLKFTVNEVFAKDNHYTLFRYEDWPAWVTFTAVFCVLLIFDNFFMSSSTRTLTVKTAIIYTLFWVCCACGFCSWVWWYYGPGQAFMWMSGYMLEWMLSFDNLFVFHMIFTVYKTPDHLKHRPLYLGICGAVFFRLSFIFIGEYLMHAMFLMHLIFGSFLIYTGVKTAMTDEDDDDPSQNSLVQWLQARMPFVSAYDERGRFFVDIPVRDGGKVMLPEGVKLNGSSFEDAHETASINYSEAGKSGYGAIDFDTDWAAGRRPTVMGKPEKTQSCATMLFLVLICLEVSDLLFAVDSVSAIVAQVNDLFLAYTSAVFAMLGLRAAFFIIDVLAKVFSLLKYGVSAVLVFIGVKLMLARVCHISPAIVCFVLASSILLSMLASVVNDRLQQGKEEITMPEVNKIISPLQSPVPRSIQPRAD